MIYSEPEYYMHLMLRMFRTAGIFLACMAILAAFCALMAIV